MFLRLRYDDALKLVKDLQTQVNAFVLNPTAKGLEDSKAAWIASSVPYQTEAFRFYDGPIDGTEENLEGLISSWPLDEAYVDYVKDENAPGGIDYLAGVINNLKDYPTISEEVLLADNGEDGGYRRESRLPRGRIPALGAGFVRRQCGYVTGHYAVFSCWLIWPWRRM